MAKVFWSPTRKAKLLKQSKVMTVNQMAQYHLQPVVEIERMIKHLSDDPTLIKRKYKEGHYTVTVYYAAYAANALRQCIGERASLW